jgi:hypothetical protein
MRLVECADSFDILHAVTYYLYTGKLYFTTCFDAPPRQGIPVVYDAEELYTVAHRFELHELQEKALRFLKETCHVDKIVQCTFSDAGVLYEELGDVYGEFFLRHWDAVKDSIDEFTDEVLEDPGRYRRVMKRFVELAKSLHTSSVENN